MLSIIDTDYFYIHNCLHVHLLLYTLFENDRLVYVQIRTSLDSHMPDIHQYRLSYDDGNWLASIKNFVHIDRFIRITPGTSIPRLNCSHFVRDVVVWARVTIIDIFLYFKLTYRKPICSKHSEIQLLSTLLLVIVWVRILMVYIIIDVWSWTF